MSHPDEAPRPVRLVTATESRDDERQAVIVRTLEDFLAMARAGEFCSVAIVAEMHGDQGLRYKHTGSPSEAVRVGRLELLKSEILHDYWKEP